MSLKKLLTKTILVALVLITPAISLAIPMIYAMFFKLNDGCESMLSILLCLIGWYFIYFYYEHCKETGLC
ncbi:hypothetical protein RW115_01185 [Macrococcus capreoli]